MAAPNLSVEECTYLYHIPFFMGRIKAQNSAERPDGGALRLHYHRGVEISIVLDGSGTFFLGDSTFPLSRGDVFFLDSLLLHESAGRGLELLVTHLSNEVVINAHVDKMDLVLLQPFLAVRSGFPPVLRRHADVFASIRNAFALYDADDSLARVRAWPAMQQVIIKLAEIVAERVQDPSVLSRDQNAIVARMVDILNRRYNHNDSISFVAKEACSSVSHASHLFKKYIGKSPLEYRNQLRITHAIDFLQRTNEKISTVASECGFETLSQFNRLFKANTGRPPSSFRSRPT